MYRPHEIEWQHHLLRVRTGNKWYFKQHGHAEIPRRVRARFESVSSWTFWFGTNTSDNS